MKKLMVPSINEFRLCGHLTADAELLKHNEGGEKEGKYIRATVAVNKSYKDGQGQWQKKAYFIPFTFWKTEIAERLAPKLLKGTPVLISGELTSRTWGEGEDKKFANDQRADRIQVLSYESEAPEAAPAEPVVAE